MDSDTHMLDSEILIKYLSHKWVCIFIFFWIQISLKNLIELAPCEVPQNMYQIIAEGLSKRLQYVLLPFLGPG